MSTSNVRQSVLRILLTIVLALFVGSIIILAIGENPLTVYKALINGAFAGRLGIGQTIAMFTPLLLTASAFAIAAKAGGFNVGIEGEVFLGGLAAAAITIYGAGIPKPILYVLAFAGAMLVGGLWAIIPALLKAYVDVSEICVTILMNSVAVYLTSYFVSGPMSAGTAISQTKEVSIRLNQFYRPSRLNTGVFIAIVVFIILVFLVSRTKLGYRIKMVGTSPLFADTMGISSKRTFVQAMVMSGMVAAVAGCIEVLGVHGTFLDGFAVGLGSNGMLASLIVDNNLIGIPFIAFFLAILKNGAMAMQQATSVPKSIVDMIQALFIIIATMNIIQKKVRARKAITPTNVTPPAASPATEGKES